jgi:hypothetical protein
MSLSNMWSNKRLHFNGSYIPALKGEALRPDGKGTTNFPGSKDGAIERDAEDSVRRHSRMEATSEEGVHKRGGFPEGERAGPAGIRNARILNFPNSTNPLRV